MPPSRVHFNGAVNLPDTESVMRELAARVPDGVGRIPDGETGERRLWIAFQIDRFLRTPGVGRAQGDLDGDYRALPTVRLDDGADPDHLAWADLGYAEAYRESYRTFVRLRDEGVLAPGVRFQVQYPTPLAPVSSWFAQADQARVEASYQRALFADLDRLLAEVPAGDLAVQWDVAVEIGLLVGGFPDHRNIGWDGVVTRVARCLDRVPAGVRTGLHLCYGDFGHRHFLEPDSLDLQVRLLRAVDGAAGRTVDWCAFTVPQDRADEAYFAPLAGLAGGPDTELYLALVPYHPARQAAGTTRAQIAHVEAHLGGRPWGICTECSLGRVEPQDVPVLLDRHRDILAGTVD